MFGKKSLGLALAGIAAYAWYKYSQLSEDEKRDITNNIKEKGKKFSEMVEEMHGGYSAAPAVGGRYFSVAMGMDCTMKGMGRQKMDEIAVYEVKDGKIVKEQFFY